MKKKINIKYRIDKINELRALGMTYSAIAKQLGITQAGLSKFRSRVEEKKKPNKKLTATYKQLQPNENMVAVSEDGYMVSVSDGKNWVTVRSAKLKQAIAKSFGLESWITY